MSLPFFQTEGEVSELPLPKWTEEQRVFQKEVLEFAKESVSRDAATCRTREFPYDIYRGIGESVKKTVLAEDYRANPEIQTNDTG